MTAVDGLSLDIRPGEFLTLLGSSGSGKTTLMRMIAGVEPCTSGRIYIDGRDVTDEPARTRGVGMVFQQYSLFPHMSVAENIGYGLSIKGLSKAQIEARVAEMLALIRLPEIADRRPSQLSGGQQQRVALARALATAPSILMLDEPLGALDLKLRRQLQSELKRIHAETAATFLFVTHDQEEALALSDRIAVMRAGRIEQIDTPTQLYQRPVNEFVADFIGDVMLVPAQSSPDDPFEAVIPGLGGIRLQARVPTGSFKLVVRPENVQMARPDEPDAFDVDVVEAVHEGSTTLYSFNASGYPLKSRQLGVPDRSLIHAGRARIRIANVCTCLEASQ
jgi:ABC-type Fe3+/spermidine/putrescine transport system ATPase subunit